MPLRPFPLAGCLLMVMLALAATVRAAPVDASRFSSRDVFDLEWADDPRITPDASAVVYVRRSMDIMTDRVRANLWTIDPKTGEQRPLLSGRNSYASPRWSPDGGRLAYLSSAEGSQQLYVRWMDTGQTALVTNLSEAPGSIAWSPDGRWIAFTMQVPAESKPLAPPPPRPEGAQWAKPVKIVDRVVYRADGAGFLEHAYEHVFVVPSDGGSARQLTSGDFHHRGPLAWSPDGSKVFLSANRGDNWEYEAEEAEIWSVNVRDGALAALTRRKGPDAHPLVSPDGKWIAYLGSDDHERSHATTHLYVMAPDGSSPRPLAADLDRGVESPAWSADSRGLFFQYEDGGALRLGYVSLDGRREVLPGNVGGTSLGRPYTGGAFSVARDGTIAFTLARPDRPADIAIVRRGGQPRQLTALNEDALGHKRLGEIRDLSWKSTFDGRAIQGWLVLPPDFDPAKKYPLILEIHGGPHTAYGPTFAAEIQRYAADGYVVLYANPRGSTSYGDAFANLIDRNYPGEDYDDLVSGVDAAIGEGFVDPEGLFVTGGSGGGVLTAWIIGKTSRFRAAAVVKPVINMTSFVLTADYNTAFYRYWFGAFPWEDQAAYWRRSPLSLAGRVTTPTLVMVGESDFRTPVSESEQYYQALKLRKIDTVLVRVPDAPHHIAGRPSNLIAKVDNILAWFGRYRKDPGAE